MRSCKCLPYVNELIFDCYVPALTSTVNSRIYVSIVLLSTIFLLDCGPVPTVWYFSIGLWTCSDSVVFFYWIVDLFRQCGIFLLDCGPVPTLWYFSNGLWTCSDSVPHCRNRSTIQQKNTTLSEQVHNPIETYHTVGTGPQSNRKIPHCRNRSTIQ
jgi:hypothetical protein